MSTSKHLTRPSKSSLIATGDGQTQARRDVTRLMSAIIDGLEDVKAQDIMVFDTEHLSSLFERVIVASGTSNRQTKALAASVRDAVREAGFPKPRMEGEENGEWIIVDCGPAVAHIMQPAIRQYYHLEDIWGEKPVKLKNATAQKVTRGDMVSADSSKPRKTKARIESIKDAPKKVASKMPSKKATSKSATDSVRKAPAKTAAKKAPAKKAGIASAAKKAVAKKSAGKTPVKAPAKKASAKKA